MSQNHNSQIENNPYETEAERLQREADDYTKALEHEKKRFLLLEDYYKNSKEEYRRIEGEIALQQPSKQEDRKKFIEQQSEIHALAQKKVRLNGTIGINNQLKVEINIMRKEIVFARDSIKKMDDQIAYLSKTITNNSNNRIKDANMANEINNQILALKAKHEQEKEKFELEIKKLQERLKEKDDFDEKAEKFDGGAKKNEERFTKKQETFQNPIVILQHRVTRITSINKEKKRIIDQYMKNAQIIEQAFEKIKEKSGIGSIDEIVTTFIKAEEQNYSLFNYVNLLNQETDSLEEQNKLLDEKIEECRDKAQRSEQDKLIRIGNLQQTAHQLQMDNLNSLQECETVLNEFSNIKQNVAKMITLFTQARFRQQEAKNQRKFIALPQSYDEDTTFNESNIISYLAELEEYIANLIVMIAYQSDDPNAAISSVPLEKLNVKNFDKNALSIDPPLENEKGKLADAATDVGDDGLGSYEDDFPVGSKQLYKHFFDLIQADKLQIIYSNRKEQLPQANKDD